MASFKAKFPVLQELFAKNHRGPFAPPPAGRGLKIGTLPNVDVSVCFRYGPDRRQQLHVGAGQRHPALPPGQDHRRTGGAHAHAGGESSRRDYLPPAAVNLRNVYFFRL